MEWITKLTIHQLSISFRRKKLFLYYVKTTKKMQDNFIYGDSPSFDELIEKLKELQERFHNQTWSTDFFTDAN